MLMRTTCVVTSPSVCFGAFHMNQIKMNQMYQNKGLWGALSMLLTLAAVSAGMVCMQDWGGIGVSLLGLVRTHLA